MVVFVVLVIAFAAWELRFWPEEHAVNRFFAALEQKDFERAYALWTADPNWKQHPQKYQSYPYGTFYVDWGPASEYGTIRSHHVEGAVAPRERLGSSGSGVIVEVKINTNPEPVRLWVEKKDKSLTFSPY